MSAEASTDAGAGGLEAFSAGLNEVSDEPVTSDDAAEDAPPDEGDGEDEDDGTEEGDAAEEAEEPEDKPEPAKATPDKHAIKIDGEERELTLDEIKRLASKAGGAEKAMQERAELRKQVQELQGLREQMDRVRQFFSDPQAQIDWAQRLILEQMDNEKLTPQQREERTRLRELEAENERLRAAQEKLSQVEQSQAVQRAEREIVDEFSAAAKEAGLPVTDETIARMALVAAGISDAGEDFDAAGVAAKVRESYHKQFLGHVRALEPEQVQELLGEDWLKKLRAWDLERVTKKQPARTNGAGKRTGTRPKNTAAATRTTDDFQSFLDSIRD